MDCQNHNSTQPNITKFVFDPKMTMHTTHHPTHTNSMSAITQLLQNRFSQNFENMFFGTSSRDTNYHIDVCPINISNGNICPYQEYLSCNWPDFDHTFKVGSVKHLVNIPTAAWIFVQATSVIAIFIHIRNISAVTDLINYQWL